MMKTRELLIGIVLLTILLSGCAQEPVKLEGALSVDELLANPVYDIPIEVYGEVSALGEVMCTCFFLESEGESIHVWYDTMVEDDGTTVPAVSTQGIDNGDWVVVSGELKSGGIHYSPNDFWVSKIEVLD
jgi:hypothetical protein